MAEEEGARRQEEWVTGILKFEKLNYALVKRRPPPPAAGVLRVCVHVGEGR
jgi:hypothetical protein